MWDYVIMTETDCRDTSYCTVKVSANPMACAIFPLSSVNRKILPLLHVYLLRFLFFDFNSFLAGFMKADMPENSAKKQYSNNYMHP